MFLVSRDGHIYVRDVTLSEIFTDAQDTIHDTKARKTLLVAKGLAKSVLLLKERCSMLTKTS
jgi:hypothetical protein